MEQPPVAGAPSFAADVYPIFVSSCAPCHSAVGIAGIYVADMDQDVALESAIANESSILASIATGNMPIGCGGRPPGSGSVCMTEDDFATIEAWYAAGAPPR